MFDNSKIFILYSCNEWKEYSSMRIIAASTDMGGIYGIIKNEIRQGNMDYGGLAKREGVKLFNEDLNNSQVNFGLLDYGYLDEQTNLAGKVNQGRNVQYGKRN